jgi:hypothetical protein
MLFALESKRCRVSHNTDHGAREDQAVGTERLGGRGRRNVYAMVGGGTFDVDGREREKERERAREREVEMARHASGKKVT